MRPPILLGEETRVMRISPKVCVPRSLAFALPRGLHDYLYSTSASRTVSITMVIMPTGIGRFGLDCERES